MEITLNVVQLIALKSALNLEIRTEGKLKATREPALKAYKRIVADVVGIQTGRGQKGRIEALEIVERLLAQV